MVKSWMRSSLSVFAMAPRILRCRRLYRRWSYWRPHKDAVQTPPILRIISQGKLPKRANCASKHDPNLHEMRIRTVA
jgi:hypothetical protein